MNQKVQEIKTGIKELDCLFKGLKQNSIIVIGGKPENDTTNFSLNLLANLCINGKKCLFCTFGLWRQEFLRRLITRELYNNYATVEKSNFKDYLNFITNTLADISKWNIHTIDLLLGNLKNLENRIKELQPDYIFIDTYEDLKGVLDTDEDVICFLKKITQKYCAGIFINTLLRREISERTPKQITIFDINVPKKILGIADDIILAYYYDYAEFRYRYVEEEKRVIDITSAKRLNKSIVLHYDTNTAKMW